VDEVEKVWGRRARVIFFSEWGMNSLLQMSHPAATQPAQEAAYPVLSTAVPQLNISLVPVTFSTQIAIRAIFAFLRRVINPLQRAKCRHSKSGNPDRM
jgi:hypothetical protein